MYGSDRIRALLVGDSPRSFSLIKQLLEKCGCECNFAGSLEAVKNLLRLWQFDVVLSTHGIPGYPIQTLVGLLSGSSASLFSSLRVEEGSWWLPVLKCGKECHGPVLTVGEFSRVLDDLRKPTLRVREKAHTREGDAIAAARRRLPQCDHFPPTTEQIRERSFEIHIERGGIHGCDMDDWIQADRELQGKYKNNERGAKMRRRPE
jgi:hypothetical protein